MPNWCFNSVTVSGEPAAINNLLAHLCMRAGLTSTGKPLSLKEMGDLLQKDGKILLSSFLKEAYPETFLKYDTTNHPDGERLKVGEMTGLSAGVSEPVTEELIQAYRDATAYQKETYGVVGWYDYNCRYLGCKWDSEIDDFSLNSEECIELVVSTPWSPPEPWARRLSGDWGLTVSLHYEEEGHNYAPADVVFVNGEVESEETLPVYSILGISYIDDELTEGLTLLEDELGFKLDSYEDEYLFSEEIQSRLQAWQDALPDGDDRKDYPVLARIY